MVTGNHHVVPAVALDAAVTVAMAMRAVAHHDDGFQVVVTRRDGLQLSHTIWTAAHIRILPDDAAILANALAFDGRPAVATWDPDAQADPNPDALVVVTAGRVIGV